MSWLKIVRRGVVGALIVLVCVVSLGCESKLNQQNFDKIKPGMSEADIINVIGKPVEVDPIKMPGGIVAAKEVWKDNEKSITINFLGGKAMEIKKDGF